MNRTRTYIAGDWTDDQDLIRQLYMWNESSHWTLHFLDAHELTQARDSSLFCSVKKSLSERLRVSKNFILIVGNQTDSLAKGSCQYCENYQKQSHSCAKKHLCDFRSYVKYECQLAVRSELRIIVIYNYDAVHRDKCPEIVRYRGIHINGRESGNSTEKSWNYTGIRTAIMGD